jgi:hypothetical protein
LPTSLVDVAVWRITNPSDIIPKLDEKIKLDDMPKGVLQDLAV